VRNKIKHWQKVQDGILGHPRVTEISLSWTFACVRFYISQDNA
jgi:hypothetical protein